MFDVIEVVFEFDRRLGDAGDVAVVDLRPASETGLDQQAGAVEGNLPLEFGHQFRTLGTRPDETHLAAQDIPELGQFVKTRLAQEIADARHTRIVLGGQARLAIRLGVLIHAAEFPDLEQ